MELTPEQVRILGEQELDSENDEILQKEDYHFRWNGLILCDMIQHHFGVFFVTGWVAIMSLLGLLSGWYFLMLRFPDRADDPPLIVLKGQSGSMGIGVSMSGILRLSACRAGLRIGIFRVFGPFSRDFFVPWDELTVSRKSLFGGSYAELRFGESFAKLKIADHVADRLWRAVPASWPEKGFPPKPETRHAVFFELLKQWAIMTTLASAFFLFGPRLMDSRVRGVIPVPLATLFPAVVFGLAFTIQYWRRRT